MINEILFCALTLDTNIQGLSEYRGHWVKAMQTGECGDGFSVQWSISPRDSYKVFKTHDDALNNIESDTGMGKYIHILTAGCYSVSAINIEYGGSDNIFVGCE